MQDVRIWTRCSIIVLFVAVPMNEYISGMEEEIGINSASSREGEAPHNAFDVGEDADKGIITGCG